MDASTIRVTVPFETSAGLVPPRCRHEQHFAYTASTEVDLATVPAEDAPIVMRYRLKEGAPLIELRRLGDRLLRPCCSMPKPYPRWSSYDKAKEYDPAVSADPARAIAAAARKSPDPEKPVGLAELYAQQPSRRPPSVRERLERDEREVIAAAATLVLIDGVVWEDASPPAWAVYDDYAEKSARVVVYVRGHHYESAREYNSKQIRDPDLEKPADNRLYAANRLEVAREAARHVFKENDKPIPVIGEIEIIDPSAMWDPQAAHRAKLNQAAAATGLSIAKGAIREAANLPDNEVVEVFAAQIVAAVDAFLKLRGGSRHDRMRLLSRLTFTH